MASEPLRLSQGGRIDRNRPVRFLFNRRPYHGFEGDTLASALLAGGVHLIGRSFKYHRPRGIMGSGFEEAASLVAVDGRAAATNLPVSTVRLVDGLVATSLNCWPSPVFDLGAVAQGFSRLLPAGFYYKTFMWPDWRWFEPLIRRAAGLGTAPKQATGLAYETRHQYCDILVIGAGPAGLMAALAASAGKARVMLVDDGIEPGGRLLADSATIDDRPALEWIETATATLDARDNVIRFADATAWAYREHNLVIVTERSPEPDHLFQRTWRIRARQVIFATGAIERPVVLAGNDRPGVMLASAARAYVNRYAVRPGHRAVVFTNNDSAYAAAMDLVAAGIAVSLVDCRTATTTARDLRGGMDIHPGHVVAAVNGRRHVRGVDIRPTGGGPSRQIACDLVCLSGGWNPAVHLHSQSRGTLRYDDRLAAFLPDRPAQQARSAGSANGAFRLADCLAEGAAAGLAAAGAAGHETTPVALPTTADEPPYSIDPLWSVAPARSGEMAFVDVQNDVTLNDIQLARREGFGAIEHLKRYTTAGMGIDQGKTGNVNVIGILAAGSSTSPAAIGTTTFRSPYVPIEFGAIAGHRSGALVLAYRHTPMTEWHMAEGAVMYEAGARWRRPGYYPRRGEAFQQTIDREALAVRQGAGIYDGSPLGKFEICGPDALKLLDLVYTNSFAGLKPGEGRYGLMLSDDGLIVDDGVTFRLADNRYLMTTSTANADLVYRRMEELLQVERPDWRVEVIPVTAQWANATVCGPLAREVLTAAGTDIALGRDALSFMQLRHATVAGLAARVCRVSFTGELSFEVNVAAGHGLDLWRRLMAAGAPFGLTPVGSEASHVLRVEKGFLSLGHEADGTADPHDLGMGWVMSRKKTDFIGKRAVEIRRAAGRPRRELVGLTFADAQPGVIEGSPITPGGRREASEGFVTACVWSVVNRRRVALALLINGRARHGETVFVRMGAKVVDASVTAPCFHDPAGERLRS